MLIFALMAAGAVGVLLAGNTAIFLGMGLGGLLIEALGVRSWVLVLGSAVTLATTTAPPPASCSASPFRLSTKSWPA